MTQNMDGKIKLLDRYIEDVDLCIQQIYTLNQASELLNGMKKMVVFTVISTIATLLSIWLFLHLGGNVSGGYIFDAIVLGIFYIYNAIHTKGEKVKLCKVLNAIVIVGDIVLFMFGYVVVPVLFLLVAWIYVIGMQFYSQKVMYNISKELKG